MNEETKELGERMLSVAKGAATGMWEGAKAAFHKDENKGINHEKGKHLNPGHKST